MLVPLIIQPDIISCQLIFHYLLPSINHKISQFQTFSTCSCPFPCTMIYICVFILVLMSVYNMFLELDIFRVHIFRFIISILICLCLPSSINLASIPFPIITFTPIPYHLNTTLSQVTLDLDHLFSNPYLILIT